MERRRREMLVSRTLRFEGRLSRVELLGDRYPLERSYNIPLITAVLSFRNLGSGFSFLRDECRSQAETNGREILLQLSALPKVCFAARGVWTQGQVTVLRLLWDKRRIGHCIEY
jgi:hypothetical protein